MPAGGYCLIAVLDPTYGQMVRSILEAQGLETSLTRDGGDARAEFLSRGVPHLLICDLSLPRRDGFALLRDLRALASPGESSAIVVTAFPELRVAADAARDRLGIAAVLPARASHERLVRAVKRALDHDPGGSGLLPDDGPLEPAFSLAPAGPGPLASVRWRAGDEGLTALAQSVAERLGVSAVFVVLGLGDRIAVPARVGVREPSDARALLDQAVAGARLLVVPDTATHPLFEGRPAQHRGYAAAPLISANGDVLGALCVGHHAPLDLGPAELDELRLDARRFAGEIELRADRASSPLALAGSSIAGSVLDHLEAGVALVDGEGRVTYANAALAEMVDVPVRRLGGLSRQELVVALGELSVDAGDVQARLRVAPGLYSGREDVELSRPRRRVLRWTARPLGLGDEVVELELFTDITAEVDLARERELLARTDWLTGLVNRRGGAETIAREVARSRRLSSSLCFALFDIDEFKTVNDVHGHAVGDEVLKEVSRVLLGALRGSDLAVRWGGDELLVVLPGIPESGARVFAERVRKKVAAIEVRGLPRVTLTCGVAEVGKAEDVSAAFKRADARLYEAKAAGRNRVR